MSRGRKTAQCEGSNPNRIEQRFGRIHRIGQTEVCHLWNLVADPIDREFEKLGYDIESRIPSEGRLRFIEVKGRITGADVINVTRNEILYSLNKPDDFILAIVEFDGEAHKVHYLRTPFQREPDFGVTSVNYSFAELLARAEAPR